MHSCSPLQLRFRVHSYSLSLIASWALGDAFKTYYFLSSDAPMQFIMCGLVQLIVDAVIVVQLWVYREVA